MRHWYWHDLLLHDTLFILLDLLSLAFQLLGRGRCDHPRYPSHGHPSCKRLKRQKRGLAHCKATECHSTTAKPGFIKCPCAIVCCKSSLSGFSIINHPAIGVPPFLETPGTQDPTRFNSCDREGDYTTPSESLVRQTSKEWCWMLLNVVDGLTSLYSVFLGWCDEAWSDIPSFCAGEHVARRFRTCLTRKSYRPWPAGACHIWSCLGKIHGPSWAESENDVSCHNLTKVKSFVANSWYLGYASDFNAVRTLFVLRRSSHLCGFQWFPIIHP